MGCGGVAGLPDALRLSGLRIVLDGVDL